MVQFKDAHIHTIEEIVTNNEDIRKPINDKRISKDTLQGKGDKRLVVVNANRGTVYSVQSGRVLFMGECESAQEADLMVRDIFTRAGISYDLLTHQRVDFKFDLAYAENAQSWVKYCNLLIAAYTVMWKCKPKDLYCGQAGQYGEYKNNKAKHGAYELEIYNKEIEKRSSAVPFRLELRCLNRNGQTTKQTLRNWQKSLNNAKDYYTQATTLLNMRLEKIFREKQESASGIFSLNSFIHDHIDGIFSRNQLRSLYAALGAKNPDGATKRYCDRFERNSRLFINKGEFETFIDELSAAIDTFIN